MTVKEKVKVKESIKKIDSELLNLNSKSDILEGNIKEIDSEIDKLYAKKRELRAEKETIIENNHETVLELDLGVISRTIEVLNDICNKDYINYSEASIYLNRLFNEVNTKYLSIKEGSSVNTIEEKAVEVETK